MAYSGTLTVVTTAQDLAIQTQLETVFTAVVDFLYSIAIIFINFFSQTAVLGSVVAIVVIYGAWRMLKRKGLSL